MSTNQSMKINNPIFAAIIVTLIWGANVVAIKMGVTEVAPSLLNAVRFGFLALLLIPFCRIPMNQLKPVLVISVLMGIGHFYMLNLGTSYVDSNTAVILIMLGAPISSVLAFILGMDTLSRKQVLGVVLAFSGVSVPLILKGNLDLQLGAVIVAFSMLCWAITNILIRKLENVPLLSIQFWIGLVSAPISLFGYSLTVDEMNLAEQINMTVIAVVLFMVLASSIFAYSLWYSIVNQYGINRVVNMTFLQPVFTMIFAYLLLNEVLSFSQLIGSLVTLGGIAIYYHRSRVTTIKPQD